MEYVDYDESVDGTWDTDFDVAEFLERSQEQRRERLEQAVERIDQQLEGRESLHQELVAEVESKLEWYVDRLQALQKQGVGKTGEREHLKQKIEGFYQELRREQRQFWKDQQELEKERRTILRNLDELDDDFIDNIL